MRRLEAPSLPARRRVVCFGPPSEASEDCWRGRGGRLPGLGCARARQSAATTTIGSATTTTTTTIDPPATTTWG
jgi:hypothetical protein